MSDELEFKKLFESQRWESPSRPALHIEWGELDEHASNLLSTLLKRKICAAIRRDDYYYWNLDISDTPVSEEEMELLFLIADADDEDRESSTFDEYPITELCQDLSRKLISKTLPFFAWTSFADDEGIWFVGSEVSESDEKQMVNILVSYPETDCAPDLIRFQIDSDVDKDTVFNAFTAALKKTVDILEVDRFTHMDETKKKLEHTLGYTAKTVMVDFECDAW